MEIIEWEESLSIDVTDMDDRMKVFFQFVNKLGELSDVKRKKEEDYEQIGEALADVTEFMRGHFNEEEKLLIKYKYPELANHKRQHKRFLSKVMAFRRLFADEPEKVSADAHSYVQQWIVDHIVNGDRRFAPYVRVQAFLNDQKSQGRRGRS